MTIWVIYIPFILINRNNNVFTQYFWDTTRIKNQVNKITQKRSKYQFFRVFLMKYYSKPFSYHQNVYLAMSNMTLDQRFKDLLTLFLVFIIFIKFQIYFFFYIFYYKHLSLEYCGLVYSFCMYFQLKYSYAFVPCNPNQTKVVFLHFVLLIFGQKA